jgi:hypothetical protein
MHEIGNFSAPDFVLAGKTIHIRTGTSYPAPLDDYRWLSGLGQMPGKVFSAFAASNDYILVNKEEWMLISRLSSRLKFAGEELGSAIAERPVFVSILRY